MNVKAALSPEDVARACADAMWAEDDASKGLGMEIVEIGPGFATLAMTVRPDMVNGQRIAHGGFIFTLADSAFAFACNSHNDRVGGGAGPDHLHQAGQARRPARRKGARSLRAAAAPASTTCASPPARPSSPNSAGIRASFPARGCRRRRSIKRRTNRCGETQMASTKAQGRGNAYTRRAGRA